MKTLNRTISAGLLCAALAALCALTGCQKQEGLPKPDLPLEEQTITDTLEQVGLDWVIDEEGTQSSGEGQILHSLRDPEKGYPNGGPDSRLLCASIISAEVDGERYLTVSFLPESAANFDWEESRPFAWEDWEKHLKLATLLYGGFEREDELYWAASQLEVSSVTANDLLYQQLTGGYCRVRVSKMDRPSLPDEARMVTVTICESKEMYEKLVAEAEEKHQELQEKYSDVNAVG